MAHSTVFESTRVLNSPHSNVPNPIGFIDAIFQGLAPDGGLYVPVTHADLSDIIHALPADISFAMLAAELTRALFPDEFSKEQAVQLCDRAFDFEPHIQPLIDNIQLLELFHGPSCAFKDFGACYLASIMEQRVQQTKENITILTATSGDTGSAVAQAFHNKQHIKVVILFPSGRVSYLQEKQLTSVGDNVYALEVNGTFDDCQRMVKQAFQNQDIRMQYGLSSANSINIGRLIPQAMYYIYTWNLLRHRGITNELFCVPSGNFGNLTGGLLAMRWGMPIRHIIAASNANHVVPEYLHSGIYRPTSSIDTLANAMDVGTPSNFERMYTMYTQRIPASTPVDDIERQTHKAMTQEIYGTWVDDTQIQQEIKAIYTLTDNFICPHTAVGVHAAKHILEHMQSKSFEPLQQYNNIVVLSTAHAGKFSEIIQKATGTSPTLPSRLKRFLHCPSHSYKIEPHDESLALALQDIAKD